MPEAAVSPTAAPRFRNARRSLSPDEVARLVHMRKQGATWKEIGVAFRKQETACKAIFDKASAASAPRL